MSTYRRVPDDISDPVALDIIRRAGGTLDDKRGLVMELIRKAVWGAILEERAVWAKAVHDVCPPGGHNCPPARCECGERILSQVGKS